MLMFHTWDHHLLFDTWDHHLVAIRCTSHGMCPARLPPPPRPPPPRQFPSPPLQVAPNMLDGNHYQTAPSFKSPNLRFKSDGGTRKAATFHTARLQGIDLRDTDRWTQRPGKSTPAPCPKYSWYGNK